MNGIAEKVNRILTEHASAMLLEAQLPIGFWAAAVLNATYHKNRSPTRCLDSPLLRPTMEKSPTSKYPGKDS